MASSVTNSLKTTKNEGSTRWLDSTGWLLACVPFGLPLFYLVPLIGIFETEKYRAAALFLTGVICVALGILQSQSLRPKLAYWEWLMLGLVLVVALSTIFSSNFKVSLLGMGQDYQGLLTYIGSVCTAYWASRYIQSDAFWRWIGIIGGLVCLLSLATGLRYILQDYRLGGLLFHATGISIYAVITLGINMVIMHKKARAIIWVHKLAIISALLVIVTSSSRIGAIAFFATIVLLALILPNSRMFLYICLGLFIVSTSASYLFASPVQRVTDPSKVEVGVSYRLQLYKWTLQESRPSVIGLGPSQVSSIYYRQHHVRPPATIQKTFESGTPLWYSHSQLIDNYIEYGIVGLTLFISILVLAFRASIRAVTITLRSKNQNKLNVNLIILITLIVSMLNFLVNTPSIELLPIMFLAIFGSFRLTGQSHTLD